MTSLVESLFTNILLTSETHVFRIGHGFVSVFIISFSSPNILLHPPVFLSLFFLLPHRPVTLVLLLLFLIRGLEPLFLNSDTFGQWWNNSWTMWFTSKDQRKGIHSWWPSEENVVYHEPTRWEVKRKHTHLVSWKKNTTSTKVCLLWNDKARAKNKAYFRMSVRWKTKN